MSRFDSRDDYEDFQCGERPEVCATPGCENFVDTPLSTAFCYACRCRDLERQADANDRHRREQEARHGLTLTALGASGRRHG